MPNPTGYYRPQTVEEAVRLVSQPHITAALLSGGALRLATTEPPQYEAVVDLQAIDALKTFSTTATGALRIGGSVTLQAIITHDATPELLRQAIARAITWNRRNAITLGELVEFPGEAPEVIAALLALGADLLFAVPEERRIPLGDLDLVQDQPKLPQRGLMTAVEVNALTAGWTWGSGYVARTPADPAIVYAAAVLAYDEDSVVNQARLVLSGTWAEKARLAEDAVAALAGKALDGAAIDAVLAVLDSEIAPEADYRGSVDYRRAMAGVLARRALEQCRGRMRPVLG